MAKQDITIQAPNFQVGVFKICGTSPYVQNKFSQDTIDEMKKDQEAGSTTKKGAKRQPKDFKKLYEGSIHKSTDGWIGIPTIAFRSALVSACRVCGFQMTKAKLAVFIEPDGFEEDGTGLVKITKGKPKYFDAYVRLPKGPPDIRPRAMWSPGWEAKLKVRFDADMFTLADVANLLARVGTQVGIGEGRNDSKNSCGQGWGEFTIGAAQ